jgi:hypothetical protein
MSKKNISLMSVFICGVTFGSSVHAVKKNMAIPDDQPKITKWLSPRVQAFVQRKEEEEQKRIADEKLRKKAAKESYWKGYDYRIKTELTKG